MISKDWGSPLRLRCSARVRSCTCARAALRADGATEDRSRACGRRSERRRAHRGAASSRRAPRARRLRRRHEHGRARRRDVRDRHASRGDPARGARDRLGAHHRWPGPARAHADQAEARDDGLHAAARTGDEQERNTHARRAHRHAGDRAVHSHARRAVPLYERFRRAADSVSRRRDRHGRRGGRGPRPWRSLGGHAREHGAAGRVRARDARRQDTFGRRHDAKLAGRHRARALRRRGHRRLDVVAAGRPTASRRR